MRFLKKLALALLACLAALPAFADSVTPQRAAEVAASFFAGGAKRGVGQARLKAAEVSTDAYMAFNREGGGFVVIALNDAVTPVLAYSPEGEFPAEKDMPEPMAWWFASLAEQINAVGDDVAATEAVRAAWENPEPVRGATISYETAVWGQQAPYNNLCPEYNGAKSPTGCVAAAAGIIARYFQWPDAGVGTVPERDETNTGAYYPAHDLGYSYDWDNILMSYSNGYSDEQASAVATLQYDMATLSRVTFGDGTSSANITNMVAGLKEHMKYDKGAYVAKREEYSETTWKELLLENLQTAPVIYGANDPDKGGHAFVVDGYDGSMFHINWGWRGGGNCYCTLSAMIPSGIYSQYNFSAGHEMVAGLVPDRDGTSTGRDLLSYLAEDPYHGIYTDAEEIVPGTNFWCYVGKVRPVINAFSGYMYVTLYDKEGNIRQDISQKIEIALPLNSKAGLKVPCKISSGTTIHPGDNIRVRYTGEYNSGIISSGEGCDFVIIVMEDTGEDPTAGFTAEQTAASTTLSFDKATKVLTLTFANPANWAVKNSGGADVAGGVAIDGGAVAIDMSGYASGTYTISIGSADDPFTFTITK